MLWVGVMIYELFLMHGLKISTLGCFRHAGLGGFKILNVYGPAGTNLAQQ